MQVPGSQVTAQCVSYSRALQRQGWRVFTLEPQAAPPFPADLCRP